MFGVIKGTKTGKIPDKNRKKAIQHMNKRAKRKERDQNEQKVRKNVF